MNMKLRHFSLIAGTLMAACPALADSDGSPPTHEEPAYKFTLGRYALSDHSVGWDANLRRAAGDGHAWIGFFRLADQDTSQWRGGWDGSYGSSVRLAPSIQVASGGFVGGSLQIETGETWFAGTGLGRTNLRNYWNLNFDPNDSYTLYAGHRGAGSSLAMVQLVADNRLNPDQKHLHFLWRQGLEDGRRLTLDALFKRGMVDDRLIQRWGLALTHDWPSWFLRLAFDPNANFNSQDMWRLSAGVRF